MRNRSCTTGGVCATRRVRCASCCIHTRQCVRQLCATSDACCCIASHSSTAAGERAQRCRRCQLCIGSSACLPTAAQPPTPSSRPLRRPPRQRRGAASSTLLHHPWLSQTLHRRHARRPRPALARPRRAQAADRQATEARAGASASLRACADNNKKPKCARARHALGSCAARDASKTYGARNALAALQARCGGGERCAHASMPPPANVAVHCCPRARACCPHLAPRRQRSAAGALTEQAALRVHRDGQRPVAEDGGPPREQKRVCKRHTVPVFLIVRAALARGLLLRLSRQMRWLRRHV
jgi:hypothetical protein